MFFWFVVSSSEQCYVVGHLPMLFLFLQGKQYYPCPIKEGTRSQREGKWRTRSPTVCNCKAWDLHWGLLALKACSLHFSGLTASGVLCLTTQCLLAVLSSKNSVPGTKRRISTNSNELSSAFPPQLSTQASSQSALYILPTSWHRILKVIYSRAKSQWNLLFLLLHQGSSSVILTHFVVVSVCLYRTQPSWGLLPCFLLEWQQFHPLWLFNHQMLS